MFDKLSRELRNNFILKIEPGFAWSYFRKKKKYMFNNISRKLRKHVIPKNVIDTYIVLFPKEKNESYS